MEGIAMGLRVALNELRELVQLGQDMVVVGGGSKSHIWRQIYADMYHMKIIKTNIDQQAAALGAAAVAAVGAGLWPDFERIDQVHRIEACTEPVPAHMAIYDQLLPVFCQAAAYQADLGDRLTHIK
jgi:xylulokinase